MDNKIIIQPIGNEYSKQIVDLILPIQQIEFNVPVTMEDQPDLLAIEKHYHHTGGNFWGALQENKLLGTIALISIGHRTGAIRKMFVKQEYRGKEYGIAKQLLEELILYCNKNEINELYLGTVDILKAAHRFYERNGFSRIKIEEIPAYFPRMTADNVYYHLSLTDQRKRYT
jgi:N-acetylglutamate synthase-like GNAT family acetyltransferase